MQFTNSNKPVRLKLIRDISKHIKRGNPWVFADVIENIPKDSDSNYAILYSSNKKEVLAHGFFSSTTNLAFRVVNLGDLRINNELIETRLISALSERLHLIHKNNNSARLINGEGDLLPGIVCDYYNSIAVLKLDGPASEMFWNKEEIAQWLMNQTLIPVSCVYYKRKNKEEIKGEILAGFSEKLKELQFLENGACFETNIIDAAKTGFFIDQRENRLFLKNVAKEKTVLNLFGYTGGFSIFAGLGQANQVATVDIAPNAIQAANLNWELNGLDPKKHQGITADAFEFVKQSLAEKKLWDIVITDPPSFAPNQKAVEAAKSAYIKIFSDSIRLVKDGGYFAASSCSGHISFEMFSEILEEAISQARRRGRVVIVKGQPEDHPYPLALSEMRYLKFTFIQVFHSK
jgi:23S rRNA (cytosine1962-C5)-methyltransferase